MKSSFAGVATALWLSVAGAGVTAPIEPLPAMARAPSWMWPNGRFVYQFSTEVARDPQKTAAFEAACHALLAGSALRCVARDDPRAQRDRDYVHVVSGPGNHSMIGRQGGRQVLSIREWNNRFKIGHEIKHALGWAHEQQHPRRDEFVEILFENIPPAWREHFNVRDIGNEGAYDFDSIMHYHPADLALPARRSIRARPRYRDLEAGMGQRDHLSETDLQEIRAVYGDASVEWSGR
jgi:hypothetical protein